MSDGGGISTLPDEVAIDFGKLVADLQDKEAGIKVKDRKRRLTTYKNCFVGCDFVDWVCKRLNVDRGLGNKMLADNYFEAAISHTLFSDSKFFYRWCESAVMSQYDKKLRTVPLNTVTKVVKKADGGGVACVVTTDNERTCMTLIHQDIKEVIQWVLTVDGLLYPYFNATSMNPFVKMSLLQSLYFDGWKGGYIKSSYDEEWSYTSDGMIYGDIGVDKSLKFVWNGETLVPNAGPDVGFGHWNGVRAAWVLSHDRPVKDLVYVMCRNEYKCQDRSHSDWVWTKGVFLASKSGEGEWITEGSVPPPVVFLLQLFRYYCLSKSTPIHFNTTASSSD